MLKGWDMHQLVRSLLPNNANCAAPAAGTARSSEHFNFTFRSLVHVPIQNSDKWPFIFSLKKITFWITKAWRA